MKKWPFIILLYLLCIGLPGMLEPVEVYFQKEIVAGVTRYVGMGEMTATLLLFLLVTVLLSFQSYASPIAQNIVGLKVASWIEGKIYRNVHHLPLEFLDSADDQVKIDRAKQSIVHISSGPVFLMYSLSYLVSLLIPTIQLMQYPILLVAYYVSGLIAAVVDVRQKQKAEELRKSIEVDKRALRYFSSLLGSKDVMIESRVHGYGEHFYRKWENLTQTFFEKQIRLKKQQVRESLGVSVLQQLIGIVPIGILYFLIVDRTVDVATYTLVTGMGGIITRYIGYLFNAYSKSAQSGIYIDDMEEVLNFVPPKKQQLVANRNHPIVSMNDVSFHYVKDKPVLRDIHFEINENEIVAIVGENGSGKTTLSLLALGLYKPKAGTVAVYGHDITGEEFDLRGIISPVFQDYTRYEFTVRENIGYGDLDAIRDDDRLEGAMLSGGFKGIYDKRGMTPETFLGKQYETDGEELSGGEWQRVAISRGIFGNAGLIVLDEPTASLDPISEIRLFTHIKNSLHGRAAVIVSHRIGICKLADRIVFMKQGRVVESGTHAELYTMKGEYYRFFMEQSKWYDWSDTDEKGEA
ncbi:MAG: ABC transporter ATP-binding protein [Clostridia bacterium]|nr:ABC transporter ATP-binding protein [Clostridia bacterium]